MSMHRVRPGRRPGAKRGGGKKTFRPLKYNVAKPCVRFPWEKPDVTNYNVRYFITINRVTHKNRLSFRKKKRIIGIASESTPEQ